MTEPLPVSIKGDYTSPVTTHLCTRETVYLCVCITSEIGLILDQEPNLLLFFIAPIIISSAPTLSNTIGVRSVQTLARLLTHGHDDDHEGSGAVVLLLLRMIIVAGRSAMG